MDIIKPTLAKNYDGQDPRGWWMSEKLDGVRAIWNGSDFHSRSGKSFPVSDELKSQMPSSAVIDGEMFGGRGMFQKTVGRVRSGDWHGLHFMAFDLVSKKRWEARQKALQSLKLPSWVKIVEQVKCRSSKHLETYEQTLIDLGAEGVMLRRPGSSYTQSRTKDLMKLKRIRTEEATVIGYQDGQGKHEGRLGALVADFAGAVFRIGTGFSDAQREAPPAIGASVTFSFFELTDGGKPRFPTFIAARDYE